MSIPDQPNEITVYYHRCNVCGNKIESVCNCTGWKCGRTSQGYFGGKTKECDGTYVKYASKTKKLSFIQKHRKP